MTITTTTIPAPLLLAAKLGLRFKFTTNSGGGVWIKATAPNGADASEQATPDEAAIAEALARVIGRVAASLKSPGELADDKRRVLNERVAALTRQDDAKN